MEACAGRVLWCGFGEEPGEDPTTYTSHARFIVEELGAGGVILFTRNIGEFPSVRALNDAIHSGASQPPLIGIDQEGGRVCRIVSPGMVFPGNMALGSLDTPRLTHQVARSLAGQLRALGFDLNFAPSVDVNNNADNPVIGVRSFGSDPALVGRHGVAAIQGFLAGGIIPVAKHFPGHGNTSVDSHLALPVQRESPAQLQQVEWAPFRRAIVAGTPVVMSSHILFTELDPELPATLSGKVLTDILRGKLGFNGVVVTDCLEMRAIADRWPPEQVAPLAIAAGADALLVCHTRSTQIRMRDALVNAVRAGTLPEERLREAAERVTLLQRHAAGLGPRPALGAVSHRLSRSLERSAMDQAIGRLPGAEGHFGPCPLWHVTGCEEPAHALVERLGRLRQAARYAPCRADTLASIPDHERIVLLAEPGRPFARGKTDPDILDALSGCSGSVVVSLREPYLLADYPSDLVRIAAWGSRSLHIGAIARALTGLREQELRELPAPPVIQSTRV